MNTRLAGPASQKGLQSGNLIQRGAKEAGKLVRYFEGSLYRAVLFQTFEMAGLENIVRYTEEFVIDRGSSNGCLKRQSK